MSICNYDYDKDVEKLTGEVKELLSEYLPDVIIVEGLASEITEIHKNHLIAAIKHFTEELKNAVDATLKESEV